MRELLFLLFINQTTLDMLVTHVLQTCSLHGKINFTFAVTQSQAIYRFFRNFSVKPKSWT